MKGVSAGAFFATSPACLRPRPRGPIGRCFDEHSPGSGV